MKVDSVAFRFPLRYRVVRVPLNRAAGRPAPPSDRGSAPPARPTIRAGSRGPGAGGSGRARWPPPRAGPPRTRIRAAPPQSHSKVGDHDLAAAELPAAEESPGEPHEARHRGFVAKRARAARGRPGDSRTTSAARGPAANGSLRDTARLRSSPPRATGTAFNGVGVVKTRVAPGGSESLATRSRCALATTVNASQATPNARPAWLSRCPRPRSRERMSPASTPRMTGTLNAGSMMKMVDQATGRSENGRKTCVP